MKWTLWDRWILEGDMTVQDVLDWFTVRAPSRAARHAPRLKTPDGPGLHGNLFSRHLHPAAATRGRAAGVTMWGSQVF